MRRVALLIIAIVLWLPPAAGAGPIATVGSAQGEAEVRNQFGLEGWMPQLPANLVFREVMPGIDERSLEAVAKLASAPVSIQATTLRRGDPQLVFTGNSEQYVSTRASFIASIP